MVRGSSRGLLAWNSPCWLVTESGLRDAMVGGFVVCWGGFGGVLGDVWVGDRKGVGGIFFVCL